MECGSTVSEAPAAAFSTDRRDMTELLLCVEMQVCLVGSFSYAPRRHHDLKLWLVLEADQWERRADTALTV